MIIIMLETINKHLGVNKRAPMLGTETKTKALMEETREGIQNGVEMSKQQLKTIKQ